jgi:hypothetical protein
LFNKLSDSAKEQMVAGTWESSGVNASRIASMSCAPMISFSNYPMHGRREGKEEAKKMLAEFEEVGSGFSYEMAF